MKLLFRIFAVIILSILLSKLSFADRYSDAAYNGDGSFETYNQQTGENSTIEID